MIKISQLKSSFTNGYTTRKMKNFNDLVETEGMVHTLNNMGYMTKKLDPYSKKFINYCKILHPSNTVLEVGAAFGVATFQILKENVNIICNDLDLRHLQYIFNLVSYDQRKRINFIPGKLPEDLNFREQEFSAILASRILHLITGENLEIAMHKFYKWLKPGGRVYIIADTPYLKPFRKFFSMYEKNKNLGIYWPGFIQDSTLYKEDNFKNIPSFINFLDKETLMRTLKKSNFSIISCEYIDQNEFPSFLKNQGKESIGIIGQKPF